MTDYNQGYKDALDDVQEAMQLATRVTMGPDGVQMFNDPELFTTELKRISAKRPKH